MASEKDYPESQLILTIQDLAMGLNSRSQTDAILLDFSKAFGKVPHQQLGLKASSLRCPWQHLGTD
ncbi:MAG: hypothetical protein AB2693_15905 [Candidatus Thiodiazotropha sp.]